MRHIWGGGEIALPNVSHCINENEVHYNPIHDYSKDYFTIIAKESGTITFGYFSGGTTIEAFTSMSYKKNDSEWVTTQYDPSNGNTVNVSVNNGDKVQWKGINNVFNDHGRFISDCHVDVEGNVMSLLYGDNFSDKRSLEGRDNAFCYLFCEEWPICLQIVSAENLILPATTLAESCYNGMFYGCTSLTTAPKKLPATTLATNCYSEMFKDCTSLTTAPELPATTLADGCYFEMFFECANLTTAPELPATTLADGCYIGMFAQCSSLNYIKAMFTTTPSVGYTEEWVSGVASTGTFVKNSAATWNVTGINGIPTGWTVQGGSDQTGPK